MTRLPLFACLLTLIVTSLVGGELPFVIAVLLFPFALLFEVRRELALPIGAPVAIFGGLTLAAAGRPTFVNGLPLSSALLLGGLWLACWLLTSRFYARHRA